MEQLDLFASDQDPQQKPAADLVQQLEVLITVKAAPQPSAAYGETVCVAGISTDLARPGWVRLYPINFRYLEQDLTFRKYDVVQVQAKPARADPRAESWQPQMGTLRVLRHLDGWKPRLPWVTPYLGQTMCALFRAAKADASAPSLGLIRVRSVRDLKIEEHPGWSPDEQRKIDGYTNQLDLLDDSDRTPLQAPRVRAKYRWHCYEPGCRGHEQGLLDWEFVALQRHLRHLGLDDLKTKLRAKFFTQMCAPERELAFYVGNQAKRAHVFSVLGVFWPPRGL